MCIEYILQGLLSTAGRTPTPPTATAVSAVEANTQIPTIKDGKSAILDSGFW